MAPAVAPAMAGLSNLDELMPSEDDLLYEEELLRNPYSLKMWWRYMQARSDAPERRRHLLFERALRALPGSFKVRLRPAIDGDYYTKQLLWMTCTKLSRISGISSRGICGQLQ